MMRVFLLYSRLHTTSKFHYFIETRCKNNNYSVIFVDILRFKEIINNWRNKRCYVRRDNDFNIGKRQRPGNEIRKINGPAFYSWLAVLTRSKLYYQPKYEGIKIEICIVNSATESRGTRVA